MTLKTLADAKRNFTKNKKVLVKNYRNGTTKKGLILETKTTGFTIGFLMTREEVDKYNLYNRGKPNNKKALYKKNTMYGSEYYRTMLIKWQTKLYTIVQDETVTFLAYYEDGKKMFPSDQFNYKEKWLEVTLLP